MTLFICGILALISGLYGLKDVIHFLGHGGFGSLLGAIFLLILSFILFVVAGAAASET